MTESELDLRLLTTFVAVAETLHFGRAADRLHLAQPAVSQQIRRLESTLGTALFVRNRRSTALSEAGTALFPEARRTLAAAERAVDTARAAARGEIGWLRLGLAPSAAADTVLAGLRTFLEARPRLTVEVREQPQRELIAALRRGDLDLAVGAVLQRPAQDAGISWVRVTEEPFVVALPVGHAHAGLAAVPLDRLDGETWVGFARADGPRYHDAVAGLLAAAGVTPGREAVVRERSTLLALVAAGLGVAIVPAGTSALRPDDIAYRTIVGRTPRLTTILAWRTDDTSPVLARLLAHLQPAPAVLPRR